LLNIFKKYGIKRRWTNRWSYLFLKEIYLKCQEANLPVKKSFCIFMIS
jgi:hypothetical protein